MAKVPTADAETEHQNHHYTGNRIPWYVHLLWVSYWVFAIAYAVKYFVPDLQVEMISPP